MRRSLIALVLTLLSGICLGRMPLLSQARGQGPPPRQVGANPGLLVSSAGTWRPIQRGVELRTCTLERVEPHYLIDLKLVSIEQRWMRPQILYGEELGFKSADVKSFAARTGAVAAINANYFDERDRPLGLLKTRRSRPHSGVSKSTLYTGVFGIKGDAAFVIHRDELNFDGTDEAIQAGPLLVAKGAPLTITRAAGRQSRRSLIGIDKNQRIVIAVTDTFAGGLSWLELQEFFDSQQGLVPLVDLLNLDGGGSAQLYVKGSTLEEHVPGATPVPVAIGFFQKQN